MCSSISTMGEPKLRQRITLKLIKQWISDGYGYGHGISYTPWIRIRTRGLPGLGNIQFRYIPELGRYGNLLSDGELRLFRLLYYLEVADLREQFPCWPWPHHHPLYQHPRFNPSPIPWSSGTLDLAKRIGVSHPRYPKTKLFHIPTLDILATVHAEPYFRAVAFAVKPDVDEKNISELDAVKLAIQIAYCEELGIPCNLFPSDDIPVTLSENLKVLFPYSTPKPELNNLLAKFSEILSLILLDRVPIRVGIKTTTNKLGLSEDLGNELFHRALWFKTLAIDVRKPWILGEPATLCDGSWIQSTRNYLLGRS